jgi:hypothetical protein
MDMQILGRWRSLILSVGMALGAIFFAATPAMAGSPIVYNQHGSTVPMKYGTKRISPVKAWLPNSSHFYMSCWTDDDWVNGNYNTNRWFWGQSQSYGWGGVSASYVYYQIRVPHC